MEPTHGEKVEPRGVAYVTDASALTPAFSHPPTVTLGPGAASQAHQTDEHSFMSSIDQTAESYMDIARKWCG